MIYIIFVFLNLLSPLNQLEGDVVYILESDSSVENKIKEVDQLLLNNDLIEDIETAEVYNKYYKWLWREGFHDKAIFYATKELQVNQKFNQLNKENRALYNLGYLYKNKPEPEYYKSLDYYKKIIEKGEIDIRQGRASREIADIYDILGDYLKAIDHYNKAIETFSIIDEQIELYITRLNLSGTYVNMENPEDYDAFKINQESLYLLAQVVDPPRSDLIKAILNEAIATSNYGFYENADEIFAVLNNTEELKQFNLYEHYSIANGLNKIHLNQNKEALSIFNNLINEEKVSPKNIPVLWNSIGEVYLEQKEFGLAIENYEKAVSLSPGTNQNNSNIYLLSNKQALFINVMDLLNAKVVASKNDALTYQKLQSAKREITLADRLLDAIRLDVNDRYSEIYWREKTADLFENIIYLLFQMNEPKEVLYMIEKSKNTIFLEQLRRNRMDNNLDLVPDSIQLFNKQIKIEISNLLESNDSIDFDSIQKLLSQEKSIQNEINQRLLLKNSISYDKNNLNNFLKNIAKKSLTVSYFVGKKHIYYCSISNKVIEQYKIEITSELINQIETFTDLASKPLYQRKDLDKLKTVSNLLRLILLPEKELIKKNQVYINPDGIIARIPFEAMYNTEDKNYLIEKYEISYLYILENSEKEKNSKRNGNLVAYINTQFNNIGLTNLNYDTNLFLTKNYKTKIYKNIATNEFIKNKLSTDIVYISTHSGLDEERAWLAFIDRKLYIDEINAKNLDVELLILNACKTLAGDTQVGEGTFSIARTFMEGGANSTIATLWEVNEEVNSQLLEGFLSFYKNNSPSKSLRKSKINYLQSNQGTTLESPYYWSSLVSIQTSTSRNKPLSFYLFFSIASMILLAYFFYFKMKL